MITVIDVIRGISEMIEENFGEPPTTKDITEGFDRPCTYVQPTDLSVSKESLLKWDEMSFQIIRFATSDYAGYLELLRYQAEFSELLINPIEIDETFYIYPENVEFELRRDEMLLIVSFDINNFQVIEETEEHGSSELMETLDLDLEEAD